MRRQRQWHVPCRSSPTVRSPLPLCRLLTFWGVVAQVLRHLFAQQCQPVVVLVPVLVPLPLRLPVLR